MTKRNEISEKFALGQFFENSHHTKFVISELDEYFVVITELTPLGEKTGKKKKFTRDIFAGLIANRHFGTTPFPKRETYFDLREYEINKFFNM